ncbi:hypothetical protein BH09GEM1_BH09GEM1_39230 [soil metagenome]
MRAVDGRHESIPTWGETGRASLSRSEGSAHGHTPACRRARCTPHLKWPLQRSTDHSAFAPEDRIVYREYHVPLMYKLQRREERDRQIVQLAELPTLRPMVQPLQCFRHLAPFGDGAGDGARGLAALRTAGPARVLSRACLARQPATPRVDNESGEQPLPARARAAKWSYRHPPQISVDLERRQEGQPPAVITHAWKAQQRMHARFNHLSYRKRPQIAVVAVARELVGFSWAVAREVEPVTSL